MFDYIFSDILGLTPDDFLLNEQLDFTTTVSVSTGELLQNTYRRKRRFKPLKELEALYCHLLLSVVNDKYMHLAGSLHQSYHEGTNSSDFTFPQLFSVIKDLNLKLQINPRSTKLHNVEFGVNIVPHLPINVIMDSIIGFRGKECNRNDFKNGGDMIKFAFRQFEIKIYDKSKHLKLKTPILRIEIKVTRMEFLQKKNIPIHTLADLLNPEVHHLLGKLLVKYISQLIIYDNTIELDTIPPSSHQLLSDGQNPRYWRDIKKSNYECYKKQVRRFNELVRTHGHLHIKNNLAELIENKWIELSDFDSHFLNEVNEFIALA